MVACLSMRLPEEGENRVELWGGGRMSDAMAVSELGKIIRHG